MFSLFDDPEPTDNISVSNFRLSFNINAGNGLEYGDPIISLTEEDGFEKLFLRFPSRSGYNNRCIFILTPKEKYITNDNQIIITLNDYHLDIIYNMYEGEKYDETKKNT